MTRSWPRSSLIEPCAGAAGPAPLSSSKDLCTLAQLSHPASSLWRCVRHATLGLLLCAAPIFAHAQAAEDVLSQKEVDTLRDTAFTPPERVLAFEQFLNDRQKRIDQLIAKRHGHTDYGGDMHDTIDQFGQIVDELNDNLDDYSRLHRDVRKVLPKLLEATDRWTATLNAASDNEAYNVVRRIAVDNVKDTHELVQQLQTDLDTWFKLHPEALKEEKKRQNDPHAIHPE